MRGNVGVVCKVVVVVYMVFFSFGRGSVVFGEDG